MKHTMMIATVVTLIALAISSVSFAQAVTPAAERFTLNRTVRNIPTHCGWNAAAVGSFGHSGRVTELCAGSDSLRQVVSVEVGDNADFTGTVLFGANASSPDASPSFKYRVTFDGRSARVVRADGTDVGPAEVQVENSRYQVSWYKTMTPGVGEYPKYAVSAENEMVPDLGVLTAQQLDQNCGASGVTCNAGFSCNRTAGTCDAVPYLQEKAPWGSTLGTPTHCTDGTWVPSVGGCGGLFRGGVPTPGHGCAASAPGWCGNMGDYTTGKDLGYGWACIQASPKGSTGVNYENCKLPVSQQH